MVGEAFFRSLDRRDRGRTTCSGTSDGPAGAVVASFLLAVALAGCHARTTPIPLDPIPMADAVRIVNGNIAKIAGTLRAAGSVDGRFTLTDGRTADFHLDGTLFYLAPRYVRFDMKRFGDRKFLIGSNSEEYWYYDAQEDRYRCGRHDEVDDQVLAEIPVRSDQIIDALGLSPIFPYPSESPQTPPPDAAVDANSDVPQPRVQQVQRVVDQYQQVLFLAYDDQGKMALEKEYWLDRYWPRLVRRVVFRDPDGVVTMQSALDDYQPASPRGPLLPHSMIAEWPQSNARMRFHVKTWTVVQDVRPESVQFSTPRECRDVDNRLRQPHDESVN